MAIPSRQIGWSTQANLLWQISKQLERLTCVTACGCGTTTTTTTAIPTTTSTTTTIEPTTTTTSSSSTTSTTSSTTSTTSSTSSSTTTSTTTIEPTTTTTTTINLTSIELQYFDGIMGGDNGTPCAPVRERGFSEYFTTIECVPLIVGCLLYTDGTATAYAANGYYQYGNGDYFYLFGGVVVNVNVCPQTEFFLRFEDGANLPVLNPYNVSDWNTFFNLPANGVPFYNVIVAGPSDNEITLIGGSGITLHNMLNRNRYLQEVSDITKNVISRTATDCFADDDSLEIVKLPFAQDIAPTTFSGCTMLQIINLRGCLDLGGTVGNNNVFRNIIGNAINLSVPIALMTCDSGNPDGDIQTLQANNTVTISTV